MICFHCILSVCNNSFISRFGFKSLICLLIAPVSVHCLFITFIDKEICEYRKCFCCGSHYTEFALKNILERCTYSAIEVSETLKCGLG